MPSFDIGQTKTLDFKGFLLIPCIQHENIHILEAKGCMFRIKYRGKGKGNKNRKVKRGNMKGNVKEKGTRKGKDKGNREGKGIG